MPYSPNDRLAAGELDLSHVNSFYGPGAWLSWVLILLSCIIDRYLGNTKTQLLGIDVNLISACVYPLVCCGNILAILITDSVDEDPSVVAAPLICLRLFFVLGIPLFIVWDPIFHSKATDSTLRARTMLRVRMISSPLLAIMNLCYRHAWHYNHWPEEFKPAKAITFLYLAFWALWLPTQVLKWCQFGLEDRTFLAPTILVTLTWYSSFALLSIVDYRHSETVVSLYSDLWKSSGSHIPYDEYIQNLVLARSEILKPTTWQSSHQFWQSLQKSNWFLWAFQKKPTSFVDAMDPLMLTCKIVLATAAIVIFSLVMGHYVIRYVVKPQARLRWWPKIDHDWLTIVSIMCSSGEAYLFDGASILMDVIGTLLLLFTKPKLMVPLSAIPWSDLDQVIALICNGAIPLAFSIATVVPRAWNWIRYCVKGESGSYRHGKPESIPL